MFKKMLVASSIALLSAAANSGGYIGASFGKSDVDVSGFDDGNSVAISGGYKFNKHFALELSYIDLGESTDDIPPEWTIEVDGFNFAAVGIIPINDNVEVFGKLGAYMWDADVKERGWGKIASDDGTDFSFGLGVAGHITEQFSLVLEFQRFDIDGDDVDNVSLGVRFNF
ncbi:MAG TPA: porin family protein [Spongiibacteraceae bacterium]|jgi:OOP family OmpA-OmpF porin|nr:porin family protein [Spongiibacteraceae bacterium]HUH39196.1 porin family protein [Spongiibacteraceae bacterium]